VGPRRRRGHCALRRSGPTPLSRIPAMSSGNKDRTYPGNIRAALLWAARVLEEAGDSAPRLTAEILLGHVLGRDRVRVLSSLPQPFSREHWGQYDALIQRRVSGVPLQYITGRQEFYGLDFAVTPAVLIPRPETELLVEKAVILAGGGREGALRFVDVGTGSGCIAVAFTRNVPRAGGFAVDISPAALSVARENIARHRTNGRICLVCCDLLESFRTEPVFDFILCNLPYVSSSDAGRLDRTVVDHEPHLALFGGISGIEIYARLFPQAWPRLRTGGHLLFEIDPSRVDALRRLLTGSGFAVESILEDMRGLPRCIVAGKSDG
jgi:release factor glutamine methyltransferase